MYIPKLGKKWVGFAVLTALSSALNANAEFIVSSVRIHNSPVGYDQISLFAQNNEVGSTGTDLKSATITAFALGFHFNSALLDGDSEPDIDYTGSTLGTSYVRIGPIASWHSTNPTGLAKPWSDTNGDGIYTPGSDPNNTGQIDRLIPPTQDTAWNQATTFSAGGFTDTPLLAAGAPGVKFAQFEIPINTEFSVSGTISSSTAEASFSIGLPEPTTLPSLGAFGVCLCSRRRKRNSLPTAFPCSRSARS